MPEKDLRSTAYKRWLLSHPRFTPVIPSRKNRKQPRIYDDFLYQDRNRIECFFGKIKHFRRIATRYDKCASSYLSFLYFAGMLIWLR